MSSLISLVAALACFGGIATLPYSFYMLLRCVATATALFLIVREGKRLPPIIVFLLVVVALLFNPLFPVHLGRKGKEVWQILDGVSGLIFVWASALCTRKRKDTR